jgi:hypothetical protein
MVSKYRCRNRVSRENENLLCKARGPGGLALEIMSVVSSRG